MSQVIAEIYEIEKKIGAGGGGTVYLGRHIRLKKQIVLKADKRSLNTEEEALRREVDMLKGLSHTYIPQVYDFVQEEGVVYTVMDFIEGESLDKLLGRGQLPTQPQIIKWACQLLEALDYLHSRPPHGILHGDIKPANIMLRPSGDVCLIDFNIALALGEDGAVKVGFSRGYASPEHYGADYIISNRPAAVGTTSDFKTRKQSMESSDEDKTVAESRTVTDIDRTEVFTDGTEVCEDETEDYDDRTVAEADETVAENEKGLHKTAEPSKTTPLSGENRAIKLDVRSDIYSLGATLYHLLSGHRPAQDAREVTSLEAEVCSPAVSDIIRKAMAPNPENRYQSAGEMLAAFVQLHKTDKRVLRHKRRMVASAAILTTAFLLGGGTTFVGLKQLEQHQTALTLAEYSANALAKGDVSTAVDQAMQAIPTGKNILEAPVTPEVQKALTDALGVYQLSDGFMALNTLELPAAPFTMIVSPEGSRLAVVYAYEVAVFDLESQQKLVTLPAQNSALSDVLFLDENRIIYAGELGITAYDLRAQETLWTGEIATTLALSADGSTVAAVNRDEDCVRIYDAKHGTELTERSFEGLQLPVPVNDIFADADNYVFSLNDKGNLLAVSFRNGGLMILDLENSEEDLIVYDESEYQQLAGGFCGQYFAFTAEKSGETLFGLIDVKKAAYLGSLESRDSFLLQADSRGIFLANGNLLVRLEPETLKEIELAYTENAYITAFSVTEDYVLVATEDNCFSFYDSGAHLISSEVGTENCDFPILSHNYAVLGNRNEPTLRLMKLENHEEAQLLEYDARYAHDEARISQDGRTAMLFSYVNFRIYDLSGRMLGEVELPDAESIYDQQFRKTKEGSWLEVIWYDGTIRCYSASDGSLISEEVGKKPAKDLYEEFYTDNYRIVSNIHKAPQVYDLESGKLITSLEKDAYLTYVTQTEGYIITEYISTSGQRYGMLLNENLETLAYLPNLCDVWGDVLVFDYKSGNLRQCRLYSLQELIALGETY